MKLALDGHLPPGTSGRGSEPMGSSPSFRSPHTHLPGRTGTPDHWCRVRTGRLAGHRVFSTGCCRQSSLPAETMGTLFSRWWLMRWLMLSKTLSFVRIWEGHRGQESMTHRQTRENAHAQSQPDHGNLSSAFPGPPHS